MVIYGKHGSLDGNNTAQHTLEIRDLHAGVEGKRILNGVDLTVKSGEIHALMGPNGSGKSTLSHIIMGNPKYVVEKGDVLFDGESILGLKPDERARKGIFLAFQYPLEVPGVTVGDFLREAYNETNPRLGPREFDELLKSKIKALKVPSSFAERYVNDGFSGGEKKRCEVLQMAVLEPAVAVMDETDSGLDVDALRDVARGVNALVKQSTGILLITHYPRILRYVKPHFVHVFMNGRIRESGGIKLAEELESAGYGKE